MKISFLRFIWLALPLALLSGGCQDEVEDSPLYYFTQLNIRLTDAPVSFDEVNIDLQKVVVKGPGGTDTVDLNTNAGIYNLLDYQGGLDTLIANAVISMDDIRQIRLILGDSNTVVVNGETHDLIIPSGIQSGIKINLCLDLTGTAVYDLLLDFDAAESIHQTGNGKYIMQPVIRVMNPDANCGGNGGGGNPGTTDCTLSQGYWQNHSEYGPALYDDTWAQLDNGADTEFFGTGESYLSILQSPSAGGNAYLILARQWIAARLNVLRGASIPDDVLDAWNQGADLLTAYEGSLSIPQGSADRDLALELAALLDDYNNGITGPGPCED